VARTPTSEILATIEEVKRMQGGLVALTRAVEELANRLVKIESRLNAADETSGSKP